MKRPRISLRTALVLMTIVGVGCGLVARWLGAAQRQRAARLELVAQRIPCRHDFGVDATGLMRLRPAAPQWLIDLVGLDALYPVAVDIEKATPNSPIFGFLNDLDLSHLTVYEGDSGDEALKIAAYQPRLRYLGLHSGVTDDGLAQLAEMPNLKALHLTGTRFKGSGLARLEAPLRALTINCSAFDDEGMRHVGCFGDLRDLSVHSEAVTDQGVHHLSKLARVRSLGLALPSATDAGMHAIGGWRQLSELYLAGPSIGGSDLGWTKGLTNTTVLQMTCGLTDETLPQLSNLQKLEVLHLEGPIQATGAGLAKLRNMKSLTSLYAPPQLFSDEAMPAVAEMSSLRLLNLANSSVTDAGLQPLKEMKGLDCLWLENTAITDEGLRVVAEMPKLYALDLNGCNITPAGLARLSEMPALEELTLGGPQFDSRGLEVLRAFKRLNRLDLRNCPVSDEILPTLIALPNLVTTQLPEDRLSSAVPQQIKAANQAAAAARP